ncbi:hypothetical protein CFS9_35290 [Flavobacterium sp. CFS9]|uniref:Uncharacterized protein n=1 Tax=Flavobacterium sp. CFS9 TaxID=3143118 RepID=A0AAT9H5S6_9FLAO
MKRHKKNAGYFKIFKQATKERRQKNKIILTIQVIFITIITIMVYQRIMT